jgi:hypothetical protein
MQADSAAEMPCPEDRWRLERIRRLTQQAICFIMPDSQQTDSAQRSDLRKCTLPRQPKAAVMRIEHRGGAVSNRSGARLAAKLSYAADWPAPVPKAPKPARPTRAEPRLVITGCRRQPNRRTATKMHGFDDHAAGSDARSQRSRVKRQLLCQLASGALSQPMKERSRAAMRQLLASGGANIRSGCRYGKRTHACLLQYIIT